MPPDNPELRGPLPLFPLPNAVLFPYMVLPLHVFEPRYVRMVKDAMVRGRRIGIVRLVPDGGLDEAGDPVIRPIGCEGSIEDVVELPGDRFNISLLGLCRFEILAEVRRKPYRAARVRRLAERSGTAVGRAVSGARGRLARLLTELAEARGEPSPAPCVLSAELPFSGSVSAAALKAGLPPGALQGLLELHDVHARARRVAKVLENRIAARRRAAFWRGFFPEDPGRN